MALSDAQIAGHAKSAGFKGDALVKAVAIALGESSGNPRAYNGRGLDRSYGLWQINMIGALGPARRRQFGLSSNSDLFNPATNAKAAYAISSHGKNFTPWSVYTSGKWRDYESRARKAAGNPDSSGGSTGVQQVGLIDGLGDIGNFFEFITDPDTWKVLGMILAGGVLLLIALAGLSGQTSRLKQGLSVLTDVLPQTRGLKAAGKVA